MTLPRSVGDVIAEHVTCEVECIDRMYLNVYVPRLQYPTGVIGYIRDQLGLPVASTAPLGKLTDRFAAAMHRFARDQRVPWVDFVKGERKDDVMHRHLAGFTKTEGVLFVGRAQEKTRLLRTERRRAADGRAYPWIVRATGLVNHFYVYAVDADFGPFFLKFCSYFPYNAKLCVNGHEWAKRQAAKAGIGYTALDNAFGAVDDVAAVQAVCDGFGPADLDALLRKWLAILPHPFSAADRAAGYRYELSVLQAEFSLTQVLDAPVSGRIFFEQVIRDNLDLGRPDKVGLIFDKRIHRGRRRATPGPFRTRVLTDGVTPSLHVDYKHTSAKQYHKLGRALRTETTINDAGDFGIGKRLHHLPELRQVGFSANRRLLDVQTISHDPTTGARAFRQITDPIVLEGRRVAGLRFTDPRVQALLHALLTFRLVVAGFTAGDLRARLAPLLGLTPADLTTGMISYDLRRLRLHGLIHRLPGSHRYRLTPTGLRQAMFLVRAHDRLLRTGLAAVVPHDEPPQPSALRTAARAYEIQLDRLLERSGLPA